MLDIQVDARSQSCSVIQLGGELISASTLRQKFMTLNTAEAELVALSGAVQNAVWPQGILEEIRFPQTTLTRQPKHDLSNQ